MKVFIQNEAGSFVKNYHDEKALKWKSAVRVSRPYPFPYGFILYTSAADGCNVDCFVLTKMSLRTGQIVECDPVGLMEQVENGEEDHNVLAGLPWEETPLDGAMKQRLSEFVTHVFDHVPERQIAVGRFWDKAVAVDYVSQHADTQQDNLVAGS